MYKLKYLKIEFLIPQVKLDNNFEDRSTFYPWLFNVAIFQGYHVCL